MNAQKTPHIRLRTRRTLDLGVYAAALAVLGCTAGCLGPAASNEAAQETIVAGEQVADGTARRTETPDAGAAAVVTDYDAHLDRIRAGDCFGLGARVGTRGACLVIIESHIDRAQESYYDPETKALLARYLYDPMSDIEGWTTGQTDCAPDPFVQGEFILCGSL